MKEDEGSKRILFGIQLMMNRKITVDMATIRLRKPLHYSFDISQFYKKWKKAKFMCWLQNIQLHRFWKWVDAFSQKKNERGELDQNNQKFQFLYDRLRIKLENELRHIKNQLNFLVSWMIRIDADAAGMILLLRKDVVARCDGKNLVAFPRVSKEIQLPPPSLSNKILRAVFKAPALTKRNTEVTGDHLQSLRSVESKGISSSSRKRRKAGH